MSIKTLKIDGLDIGASKDETILQIARENGIFIPTLCELEGISPYGACRLCLIEIKGSKRLVPACMTTAEEGMEIITNSARLQKYRIMILELIFSERNHICSVCVSNGHCDLQYLAQKLGMNHIHFAYQHPKVNVDATHNQFILDHNRCILCTRCVRVCDEIEAAHTWDIMGRGINSRVIIDFNQFWGTSETCTSCGKCVQVCPTGALSLKGKAVQEMKKERKFLPYLKKMRRMHK